ncbi:MAG: hypothetical protein HYY17_06565 [Planctomycetes bacterium]|nr:hypothetical protein [Planctomycetota bacterium]
MVPIVIAMFLQAQDPKPEPPPIHVEFKDGLHFRTDDGKFEAHVGGRLLAHYRMDFGLPESPRRSSDSFFLRQARLEMSGTFFKDFEFKVQTDFPTGSSSTATGTLQDAFLGWKHFPEASILIGQFKEPFSQEETTSTRFIDFVERSVLNRLAPARDIGLMLHGRFFDGLFAYEAGVFNGQGRAVADANDEKDVAVRLRVSPFARTEMEPLKGLRLGFAGTWGIQDGASIDGLDFTSTELVVKFLDATAGSIDGLRSRYGLELSWIYGPVSLRAEWARRTDEVDLGPLEDERIPIDAWYVAATWLVTGEKKPLEGRLVPDRPLDFDGGGFGAVELAFRVAQFRVDDALFDMGAAAVAGNAGDVLTVTFGANWYLTRNFRISPNLVYEKYGDDVDFGGGRLEDRAWGFVTRFQIDF